MLCGSCMSIAILCAGFCFIKKEASSLQYTPQRLGCQLLFLPDAPLVSKGGMCQYCCT